MPPGRRKSTQPTTSQRTLAFGPHPNKVTKPNQPPPTTFKKASPLLAQNRLLTPSPPPPALEEIKSPEANLTIREPKPKAITKSESEERAAGLGEGAVRNYWRRQETERKAPRVHQQDISMHEKILRHFDLSSQYGPCIGINRLARWKRASKLGLNPPIEVLAVLVKEDAAENRKLEMAYMDELLDAKVAD